MKKKKKNKNKILIAIFAVLFIIIALVVGISIYVKSCLKPTDAFLNGQVCEEGQDIVEGLRDEGGQIIHVKVAGFRDHVHLLVAGHSIKHVLGGRL